MRTARRTLRTLLATLVAAALAVVLAPGLTGRRRQRDRGQEVLRPPRHRPDVSWPAMSVGSIRLWDAGVTLGATSRRAGPVSTVSRLDAIVSRRSARSVEVTLVLGQTPTWADDPASLGAGSSVHASAGALDELHLGRGGAYRLERAAAGSLLIRSGTRPTSSTTGPERTEQSGEDGRSSRRHLRRGEGRRQRRVGGRSRVRHSRIGEQIKGITAVRSTASESTASRSGADRRDLAEPVPGRQVRATVGIRSRWSC